MMKSTGLVLLVAFAMQGCSSKPPACSDEKTLELVTRIWSETLEKNAAAISQDRSFANQIKNAIKFNVTTIRTNQYDEKSRKYSCDAFAEVTIPKEAVPALEHPMFKATLMSRSSMQGLAFEGNVIKGDIRYTSQMTDDGKEQLVELTGQQPVADAVTMVGMLGAFKPQQPEQPSTATTKPASKPEQPSETAAPKQATTESTQAQSSPTTDPQIQQTVEASFDCALAKSHTEKLICSSSEIGSLDKRLAAAYLDAKKRSSDASQLKNDQLRWLKDVRNPCPDEQCLARVMSERLSYLSALNSR
jgi:uncharacterized protein YecT (DUF1311 family)